jgi:hypothetical protein
MRFSSVMGHGFVRDTNEHMFEYEVLRKGSGAS